MKRFVTSVRLLTLLLVLVGFLAGCGDDEGNTPVPPAIPATATQFSGNAHWFATYGAPFTSDPQLTWTQARTFCVNLGGYLASVDTAVENNYVGGIAGGTSVWIGATDEVSEGTWRWVSGEAMTNTFWAGGEPNNHAGVEHYAAFSGGSWVDYNATSTMSYVCEWN